MTGTVDLGRRGPVPKAFDIRMNLQIKSMEPNTEYAPLTFSIPVRRILETIWKQKWKVASLAAVVGVALILAKLLLAPTYTATAIVQAGLLDRDLLEQDPSTTDTDLARLRPPVVTDLSNLESQETRLLASEGLARAAVVRLGLDQVQQETKIAQALGMIGRVLPVQYTAPGKADIATQKFMQTLEVRNEPRSNLIRISATAESPEEAARMANAVVAEYVHYRKAQMLALRKSRAAALIADLAVVYGDNHPNILRARETLGRTDAALEAHRVAPPPSEAELAATGYIMPARPDSTPSGLSLNAMIFVSLLVGLVVGVASVLIRAFFFGRNDWNPTLPEHGSRRPLL